MEQETPNYRPSLHFSPPKGWINDPNGLVYFRGEWHLCYQYQPDKISPAPVYWGHSVSKDLVNWRHLPPALEPDEIGDIWSGSAAVDGDELIACFTYHGADFQAVGVARSSDGVNFEKDSLNPVLRTESADFRDPKLFKHGGEWRLVMAAGRMMQIFGSKDLHAWRLLSALSAPEPNWIWECPDLFPIVDEVTKREHWVLIGSFIVPGRPHETYYWVGEFDGNGFRVRQDKRPFGFGPDDYAAITWADVPDGRRVGIGWMNRWDYGTKTPLLREGTRGLMTLPRELRLKNGVLTHEVVAEVEAYAAETVTLSEGEAFELERRAFRVKLAGGNGLTGIRVWAGNEDFVEAGVDVGSKEVFIDRSQCGRRDFHPAFGARFSGPIVLPGENEITIYVDDCTVEIFAGGTYGSAIVFPYQSFDKLELLGSPAGPVTLQWMDGSSNPA